MKHHTRFALAIWAGVLSSGIAAAETVEEFAANIRKEIDVEVAAADVETLADEHTLSTKYVTALKDLEKKISQAGDLDGVLHIREEIALVRKSGDVTTFESPKALVNLRSIYQKSKGEIQTKSKAARDQKIRAILARMTARESALTKSQAIDQALALRKIHDELNLRYFTDSAEFKESPGTPSRDDYPKPIQLPKDKPPLADNMFASKEWMESFTAPLAKQRIREHITLGNRGKQKWPLVVVAPGSVWNGMGTGQLFLSAAKVFPQQCTFEKLKFTLDLESYLYFVKCELRECRLERGGVWWAGILAAKFYLEDSLVKGGFTSERISVADYAIRANRTVFVGIDLPEVAYLKHQPANIVKNPWFSFVNCRFVKCRIPASFLLATRDCAFDGCTFVDDEHPIAESVTMPLEATVYTRDCKSRMSKLEAPLAVAIKPQSDLKDVSIPTEESVASKIAR